MPWNLISPNRVCAKINLPKFFRNTTLLALAKFFPGENFPLYGIYNLDSYCFKIEFSKGGRMPPSPLKETLYHS